MDEEDLAEMRESKKLVDITEETDIFGGTRAEVARRGGGEPEKEYVFISFGRIYVRTCSYII